MAKKLKTRKARSGETIVPIENTALDPFRDFEGSRTEMMLAKAAYYMRLHVKETLMAAAGAALVIIGIGGFFLWRDYREEQSLLAFEELKKSPIMIPGAGDEKVAIEKLNDYIARYGDDGARIRSNLYKIDFFLHDKDYVKAAEMSVEISDLLNDNYLRSYFLLQAAVYMESAKKYGEAIQYYDSVLNYVKEENLMRALAIYGKGRNQVLSGNMDSGKESILEMMKMEDAAAIDQLKISAASFLIHLPH